MRLIDADALKTVLGMGDDCAECEKEERKKWVKCQYDRNFTKMDFCGWLDDAPTVDAVPARRGKWKAVTEDGEDYKRICSCCGKEAPFNETERVYLIYPHCPWCGARIGVSDE